MPVADYLHFAATLKGLEGEALNESVKRAIRDTDLQGRLVDPVSTLSRGYRQPGWAWPRPCSARARVLILDEPTNGLDPNQTQHMRDLIPGAVGVRHGDSLHPHHAGGGRRV